MAINLLPNTEKILLKKEKLFKKLALLFSFWIACLIIFWGLIFTLQVFVSAEANIVSQTTKEKAELLQKEQFENFSVQIQKANQNIALAIYVWKNQLFISDTINHLSKIMGDNIYFNTLSFKQNDNKEKDYLAEVNISGVALKRDDILAFKQILEKQSLFKEVFFLPYSWVKAKEADFGLNFLIKNGN